MAADAHAPTQLGITGEDRRLPAGALRTQYIAELLVEIDQAGGIPQTFTVGRIADDQASLAAVRIGRKGSQLALVDLDPFSQAGPLDIVAQRLQQARIGFIATNPQRRPSQPRLGALLRLRVQPLPQGRHMLQPVTESPVLAVQVGGDICRHQSRFNQEGTGAAHGIGQCRTLGSQRRPVGTNQHGGGEVFLERRSALLEAITALMQTVAGQIQRQLHFAVAAVYVHPQMRADLVHRGPHARRGPQAIHDRILDPQRAEMGIVHASQLTGEVHGQAAVRLKMVGPLHPCDTVIQTLGIAGREAFQDQQHPVGQARPEADPVSQLQIAFGIYSGDGFPGGVRSQGAQLVEQQALDTLRTGDKKFKGVAHLVDFQNSVTFMLHGGF